VQKHLEDPKVRVPQPRPDQETVTDLSQGVQLATMKELVRYCQTEYDWRKAEAKLNARPEYLTTIDGVDIQFIWVRSKNPNAMPLIMTHGWPGSIFELLNVIDPLTNPTAHGGRAEDAFDIVITGDAGLRIFRQADCDRLESSSHNARLGHFDEAPGLFPLCRARRGLGRESLRGAGAPSA